ncbi:MAG: RIP metalloprotease RseP [Ignavibacteria bacterium]|nr:RIP metalloprotease RseP [Ignavibacteria bacterium]
MEFFSSLFYFIIIISVLVLVHEMGHFLTAKFFGMRVERFSIGLGPRAFGKVYGDTDYCISYVPFGGYVKILGMLDESFDTSIEKTEPQPWEFRAKPVWQRLIVITAGVIMNVLLALAIFWGLNLAMGREMHPVTTIGHVQAGSVMEKAGFQAGDKLVSVNDAEVVYWEDARNDIQAGSAAGELRVAIERGGARMTLVVPPADLAQIDGQGIGLYATGNRPVITGVSADLPASKAGLLPGDVLLSIRDTVVHGSEEVTRMIRANAGRDIAMTWQRDGKTMSAVVTPNAEGMIGIGLINDIAGEKITQRFGVIEAFTAGARNVYVIATMTVQSIWNVIVGQTSFKQSIGGPVKIAKMASQQADAGLASFLGLVAVLSISLAVINIFPIPALDGGYVIFLLFELIFRREVPYRVQYYLLQAGWFLLIGLMLFVLYNDIFH